MQEQVEACKALWTPICGALERCEPGSFSTGFTDASECADKFALSCATANFGPSSGATPDSVTQCAHSVDVSTCDKLVAYEEVKVPDVCVPKGKKADGARCLVLSECENGLCIHSDGGLCGVCGKAATTEGASCGSGSACTGALYCKGGKCTGFGQEGAACDDKSLCDPTLACVSGKCNARLADGQSCDPAAATCGSDRACNQKTKVCEAVAHNAIGQACGVLDSGGVASCARGARCKLDANEKAKGTCVAEVALGSQCTNDVLFGSECALPGECISGSCVVPTPSMCD
jgi:hypothetical protein